MSEIDDRYRITLTKCTVLAMCLGNKLNYIYTKDKVAGYDCFIDNFRIIIRPRFDRDRIIGECKTVFYNNQVVLDTSKNIYLPAKWEDLIDYLYEHRDKLIAERERKIKTIQNIQNITTTERCGSENPKTFFINDSLKLVRVRTSELNAEDLYENIITYSVSKNDKLVLYGKKREYSNDNISIFDYVPGAWEEEIDEYINELQKAEIETFNALNQESIDKDMKRLINKYN